MRILKWLPSKGKLLKVVLPIVVCVIVTVVAVSTFGSKPDKGFSYNKKIDNIYFAIKDKDPYVDGHRPPYILLQQGKHYWIMDRHNKIVSVVDDLKKYTILNKDVAKAVDYMLHGICKDAPNKDTTVNSLADFYMLISRLEATEEHDCYLVLDPSIDKLKKIFDNNTVFVMPNMYQVFNKRQVNYKVAMNIPKSLVFVAAEINNHQDRYLPVSCKDKFSATSEGMLVLNSVAIHGMAAYIKDGF